jgi:small subunit ribosomal protein S1
MVDVMVLNMDAHKKRISLGMKQVEPNPWDVIAEKYPVGTTIEGKIKNITDFGIFIGIDEGIDGLVHISDISWTRRIKHPSEVYKKGEEVQAVVLNIDKENERFSLGIKQLVPDPWNEIPVKYKPGTRVTGTVTNVTDFGIFVELEEGIEGLIHVSELPKDKKGQTLSRFQVDDVIQAKVVNISAQDKKIGLSIRKLEETSEKSSYSNYLNNNAGATSNLGELLKEEMMHFQMNSVSDGEEQSDAEPQEDEDAASAVSEADTPSEAQAAPADESESGDDSDEKSTEDTAEVSPEKTDQAS